MTNIQTQITKNQEIDNENNELLSSLNEIQEIQQNLVSLIYNQNTNLNRIEDNIDNVSNNLQVSLKNIDEASLYQTRYLPVIIGSGIGLATIGPLSLIPAFKIGGILTGITMGTVGGFVGYKYT